MDRSRPTRDIVVIGASAGGVEALRTLFRGLPPEFPASVFVVLHLLASGHSVLPTILGRIGQVEVTAAKDGEIPERGHAYVAPPDHHLMLMDGRIRVTHGPRENGHRPAVDPLFRSAARTFDGRVIGVVLSGSLDDGTAGLQFVKSRRGMTVVQDPADAQYPAMPRNAIESVAVDHVVPAGMLAELLQRLVTEEVDGGPGPELSASPDPASEEPDAMGLPAGLPSNIACPECGGVLWESRNGNKAHFRCQVGHAYSPDSLLIEHSRSLEAALWAATRTLEERAELLRRIASKGRRRAGLATRYANRAEAADQHAVVLKDAIARLRADDENGVDG